MEAVIHDDLHPDNSNAQLLKIFIDVDFFGCLLKDAILSHICSSIPNVEIVDLDVDKYYAITSHVDCHVSTTRSSSITTRSLLLCGTGVGVSIFANKHPSVYVALCTSLEDTVDARSINDCNVLYLSGMRIP